VRDEELLEVENRIFGGVTIKTSSGENRYSGPPFNVSLLETWLRLHKAGVNAFRAAFFYYDSDSLTDEPSERYTFFVVFENKVVDTQVSFSDYSNCGFDSSVFAAKGHENRVWYNEPYWQEAWTMLWYRTFYAETDTGKLMVLRPDEPLLYFFPKGRAHLSELVKFRSRNGWAQKWAQFRNSLELIA
jgi:hypothetical protein